MPRVLNRHRHTIPPDAVDIGRPGPWGNPFSWFPGTPNQYRVMSRDDAVASYHTWMVRRLAEEPALREQVAALRGKDLVCYCSPSPCHGYVLLELANPPVGSYAGIGSRQTPAAILETMQRIGMSLAQRGFLLRSGAAEGADAAFEAGAKAAFGYRHIFVPWPKFNDHRSMLLPSEAAHDLAARYHPAWDRLTWQAQRLHARNGHQVLGIDLKSPADFVVCWTPGGKGEGGTGQALRIARDHGIPIYDLGTDGALDALRERVRALPVIRR